MDGGVFHDIFWGFLKVKNKLVGVSGWVGFFYCFFLRMLWCLYGVHVG
jgi:hypothetical protein